MIKKFDITEWCDFVRGVAEPDKALEMQKILAVSPGDHQTFEILQQVVSVARTDRALEIPEHAIRGAKAIGSLVRSGHASHEPSAFNSLLQRLSFNIKFDSLLHSTPAGTRDVQPAHRQVLFEADDYTVDVRWEQEADPKHTVVIGQIFETAKEQPASDIPVYVVSEGQIVGRSQTNRFGEFQADELPKTALKLCLMVGEEEVLELPLAGSGDFSDEKMV